MLLGIILIWSVLGLLPLLFFVNKVTSTDFEPDITKSVVIGCLLSPIAAALLALLTFFVAVIEELVEFSEPYKEKFWDFVKEKK